MSLRDMGVSYSPACGGQRMMKISGSSRAGESMGCRDFQERSQNGNLAIESNELVNTRETEFPLLPA
jgi:hypothetical protein